MRTFTALFLSFVAFASAYSVSSPSSSEGWTVGAQNYLVWQRVDTDPANFTVVLTNQNRAVMPLNDQILDALVDGTLGRIVCNPPSGGWPTGDGFQVNLATDSEHLDSLLAQSNQFSITASSSSSGSTTSSSSSQSSTNTATYPVITPTSSNSAGTTTSSDTSTKPTGTNGAAQNMNMQAGFLASVALLTALVV